MSAWGRMCCKTRQIDVRLTEMGNNVGANWRSKMRRSPTTSVQGEYLMTLYVPIVEAHQVDDTLRVVNHPDGWVEGPQIKGKIIPPSSDALRNMGNGVYRLDVRLTIQTDDDQIIFVSYNGVVHWQKEVLERFVKGEMMRTG